MKPLIIWTRASSEKLDIVQPSMSTVGFDEDGEAWVSAEYGKELASVVITAVADGEEVVWRLRMPFVRVTWLKARFPVCEDVFREIELKFA